MFEVAAIGAMDTIVLTPCFAISVTAAYGTRARIFLVGTGILVSRVRD